MQTKEEQQISKLKKYLFKIKLKPLEIAETKKLACKHK